MRTSRTTPSSTSSAAATDTSANAERRAVAYLAVCERAANGSAGRSTAVISSPCASTVSRCGSSPGQAVEVDERDRALAARALHAGRPRRAPPARPPCRRDASRCTCPKRRGWPGCGDSLRVPGSRCPAPACCTASARPGSRRSGCAGAGCRRSSRGCAAGRTRRRGAPATARDSACGSCGRAARTLLRTAAPMRTPPSGSGSIRSDGRRVTSTSSSGVATPSFIRSTRFVPPPRNGAGGRGGRVATAGPASAARS